MKVEYTEESSVRKALSFEIDADTVDREIETKVRDYAKRAKIPGFRPGKIPNRVVLQRFKPQVLEDVAEKLINKVVFDEIEGRGLRPLAGPKVTNLKIDEHQPLTFRAEFETLPVVELPEYRGLAAKTRQAKVSEDDVEKEVEELREQQARFDPIEDREAREKDFAVVDIAWRPEGDGRGGRDENAFIEVGGSENHKDLNAALVGMRPGETKETAVVYAEDHPVPALAGKTMRYTLGLKGLKAKIVPKKDDEFAKDMGEFESLEALRSTIRDQLVKNEERRIDRDVKNALIADLVERASFEVPEALVERHMSARTEDMARGLALRGVDPRKINFDWKGFRESQRDDAVKAAKADIVLHEIGNREGIEATDAEVEGEISRIATRARRSVDAVRAQLEKDGEMSSLRARIREERTLDLIKSNARLEEE